MPVNKKTEEIIAEETFCDVYSIDAYLEVNKHIIKKMGLGCALIVGCINNKKNMFELDRRYQPEIEENNLQLGIPYIPLPEKIDNENWFPYSYSQMTEDSGLSISMCKKSIRRLVKANAIEKKTNKKEKKMFIRIK